METEKHKLKAQVRRLADENNWLRKELNETRQQLQDAEVGLATMREEKEHRDFINSTIPKVSNDDVDDVSYQLRNYHMCSQRVDRMMANPAQRMIRFVLRLICQMMKMQVNNAEYS